MKDLAGSAISKRALSQPTRRLLVVPQPLHAQGRKISSGGTAARREVLFLCFETHV
jgi:hypothetical protein